MARVTVEDCLENVENRFALVHATSKRVAQMFQGSPALVACDNREVVTALREIADNIVHIKAEVKSEIEPQKTKKRSRK